ncbi:MAG: HAMP domain-containing sensor histidine kinase, partial [Oscillibacter sp.]
MLRRLRLQFVAVCMALVTAVLAVVLLSIYVSAQNTIAVTSNDVLLRVIGELSYPGDDLGSAFNLQPGRVQLPYFTVEVWGSRLGHTAYVTGGTYSNLENTAALTEILTDCLSQEADSGVVQPYSLRYLREDNGLYQKIAFVDMSLEQATLRDLMRSYVQVGLAALAALLGISVLLARWTVRPVEKAWRQQRQFLADASHELKTPLTVILSNAELLEGVALDQRAARWADNIHSEAGQMKNLVEEMLTLARGDDMGPTAVLTELSLTEIATDCALAFEPVAFEAGKPLEERLAEDVAVLGDRDKLRQLLSVLLDNAIKYGGAGGAITLSLEKNDRQAIVTVSNPGEPIPPAQLSHLFERFYRADASRGERSGFGLGLSIAAAIAKTHKGTLRAESDAASTRFILSLPLKK